MIMAKEKTKKEVPEKRHYIMVPFRGFVGIPRWTQFSNLLHLTRYKCYQIVSK